MRLDQLVAQTAKVSRRVARIWISTKRVFIGGKTVRILTKPVKLGALVEVVFDNSQADKLVSSAMVKKQSLPQEQKNNHVLRQQAAVLYIDRYLIVFDKPAGLLTEHDRFGSPSLETLAPLVLADAGEQGRRTKIWLVHRLDAGTSGVVIVARTSLAASRLNEAFRSGEISKTYLALCQGTFTDKQMADYPIARAARTRHTVSINGKPARTELCGMASNSEASLVQASPLTGRTHQIRVHLSHLGHPLLGDSLYGGPMYTEGSEPIAIARPMLHAERIEFNHPITRVKMMINAPIPDDFKQLSKYLKLTLGN